MTKIINLRKENIEKETEENSEESLRFAQLQKERWKKKKFKKTASQKTESEKLKTGLKWTAPEFFYFKKTEIWFAVSGLITIALFIWALWTRNIFFAFIIILGYFIVIAYAIKKPLNITVNITPEGVKIDRTFYSYNNLKSFWIFYTPPELKEISILSRKKVMPYIKIPLGEQDPIEVRKVLIQYLPEKKQDESLIDNLSRQLRF